MHLPLRASPLKGLPGLKVRSNQVPIAEIEQKGITQLTESPQRNVALARAAGSLRLPDLRPASWTREKRLALWERQPIEYRAWQPGGPGRTPEQKRL